MHRVAMDHYVTLFDIAFMPQGMALHESMQRHAGAHTLWVLCMDEATHEALQQLALPDVRLLRLADVETPALRDVKPTRTRGEYCWTLTPWAPRFVFEADPQVQWVTYVDADLWLMQSTAALHEELHDSGKGVLITEHAYAPECDQIATSGRFCVQFMSFHRTRGETVRSWWEARCLEWCFARVEDGRFGDQKYLDDWPERFPDAVHVMRDAGRALAPWNASLYSHRQAAFYHFHGLRRMNLGLTQLVGDGYVLPEELLAAVYAPYLKAITRSMRRLRQQRIAVPVHRTLARREGLRLHLRELKRQLLGRADAPASALHRARWAA
jgi:hypothetical protein